MTSARWYAAQHPDGSYAVYHEGGERTPVALNGGLNGYEARASAAHLNGQHKSKCPKSCQVKES